MKLIIDIPEEIYIEKKEDYIGDTLDRAIANGTPLSEELEKIRGEFQELLKESIKDSLDYTIGIAKGIEILDKHIENLKGDAE